MSMIEIIIDMITLIKVQIQNSFLLALHSNKEYFLKADK